MPKRSSTPPQTAARLTTIGVAGLDHVLNGGLTPRQRKFLVVDDNKDSAESLTRLLQISGHAVEAAYDGAQALAMLAAFQPEIVLLDIGLPDMDGYEVARCMRERPEGRRALLIALTGWGQDDDRRRAKDAGFDHHMVKPVELGALKELLAQS